MVVISLEAPYRSWHRYSIIYILTKEGTSLRTEEEQVPFETTKFQYTSNEWQILLEDSTSSQSEITSLNISGPSHLLIVKYSYNNSYNNENISLSGPPHPPKVKYSLKTKSVPKLIVKSIGDTAYDSYCTDISSTEECHQAQEADQVCRDPLTSVKTIPLMRTRPHPNGPSMQEILTC